MADDYIISKDKAKELVKSLLADMGTTTKIIDGKSVVLPVMKGKHPIYGNTFPKDSSSLLDHD